MKARIQVLYCDLCLPRKVPAYATAHISGLRGGHPFDRDLCAKHARLLLREPVAAKPMPEGHESEDDRQGEPLFTNYECSLCERTFETPQGRGLHLRRVHHIPGARQKKAETESEAA